MTIGNTPWSFIVRAMVPPAPPLLPLAETLPWTTNVCSVGKVTAIEPPAIPAEARVPVELAVRLPATCIVE